MIKVKVFAYVELDDGSVQFDDIIDVYRIPFTGEGIQLGRGKLLFTVEKVQHEEGRPYAASLDVCPEEIKNKTVTEFIEWLFGVCIHMKDDIH